MAMQPNATTEEEQKKLDPQTGLFLPSRNSSIQVSSLPPAAPVNPVLNLNVALQTLTANALLTNTTNLNPLLQQQVLQQAAQQQLLQRQAAALVAAAAIQAPLTHNLIPLHLQASALAASLHGTPGYTPAIIPPLLVIPRPLPLPAASPVTTFQSMTLQDYLLVNPAFIPQYNGINPNYPGVRVVSSDPPVFTVDNFLTPLECQFLVTVASDSFGPAPVVGKGVGEISASRTSSTCYLAREDLADYMRKVSLLTGKPIEHCELPQVGRYLPSQQYLQHFDAFDTSTEDGRRFASNGGQRTITVLVYLNDVMRGGATSFPALNLDVQPRQGMALVFFPATIDGFLDKRALHAALPAIDTKFVSQVWIRQTTYNGQPSKRLVSTMGPPLQSLGAPQPPPPPQQPVAQAPGPMASGATNGSASSMIPNPLAATNLPTTF